jgi:hypothetical protein
MRVLVCGSRDWTDRKVIRRELEKLPPDTTIITGGASGADTIASIIAKELHLQVRTFYADWQRYGRAAGPRRNRQMLTDSKPDLVLAFYDPATSKGTLNMVSLAAAAGVKVKKFFKEG